MNTKSSNEFVIRTMCTYSFAVSRPLIDEANAARERRIAESKAAMLATNEVAIAGAEAALVPVPGAKKSPKLAPNEEVDEGNGTMVRQNRQNPGAGKHELVFSLIRLYC